MRRLVLAGAALLCAAPSLGDGGRVLLRQDAGPFAVTVFATPQFPTVGPADVSVLVQDRVGGGVLLDAAVEIRWSAPGNRGPTRSQLLTTGSNRLLRSGVVELSTPGPWRFEVAVRRGGSEATVSGVLSVGPAPGRLPAVWPFLAIPPIGVILFALGEALRSKRSERLPAVPPGSPRPAP